MASLVGLAVAGCEMFRRAPIVSGGSIEERELLNEELVRETGDQA